MDPEIQAAVIQKQAQQLANATLQATILEARLEAATKELTALRAQVSADSATATSEGVADGSAS